MYTIFNILVLGTLKIIVFLSDEILPSVKPILWIQIYVLETIFYKKEIL